MRTKIIVGGQTLTVSQDVVEINKTGSLLPDDIVGSKGVEADVVADSISTVADEYLRVTEIDSQRVERPGITASNNVASVPVQISQDGNQVFQGELLYQRSTMGSNQPYGQDGRTDAFSMSGDGLVLWPTLENVSLRDLDLGDVEWSATEVAASRERTADEQAGMFAPVIYGTPDFVSERDVRITYTFQYVRYQVYYYAIVKAIFEKYAKYTLNSQFFETDIFKRCVHTFGVGDQMEVSNDEDALPAPSVFGEVRDFTPLTSSDSLIPIVVRVPFASDPEVGAINDDSHRFTAAEDNLYTIAIDIEYTGARRQFAIIKNDEELYTVGLNVVGTSVSDSREIELEEDDELWVVLNSTRVQLTLTSFNIQISTPAETEGGIIRVASCLPDKGVKEYLRGISHQFNLEWGVDAVRRIVTVEPRFSYTIDGVTRPGFYQVNNPRTGPGEIDSRAGIKVSRIEGYQKSLELSYRTSYSGMAQIYNNRESDTDSIALHGIRFDDGSDLSVGAKSESRNPYFAAMITAGASFENSDNKMPHLWTGGSDVVSDNPNEFYNLPVPTYEAEPSCGFLQPDAVELTTRAGPPNLVPLMTQTLEGVNPDNYTPFCLTYGDQVIETDDGLIYAPGLGSIFYPHLASTLLRGRQVDYTARISNPQEVYTEDFKRAVALRYSVLTAYPSILLSIEKYQPGGTANLSALTFVGAKTIDRMLTKHYRLRPVVTASSACDYLLTDSSSGTDNSQINSISMANGFPLPLAYPYNSIVAADAGRLEADLTRLLTLTGEAFGDVTAAITNARWALRINSTTLAFGTALVSTVSTAFETENC